MVSKVCRPPLVIGDQCGEVRCTNEVGGYKGWWKGLQRCGLLLNKPGGGTMYEDKEILSVVLKVVLGQLLHHLVGCQ